MSHVSVVSGSDSPSAPLPSLAQAARAVVVSMAYAAREPLPADVPGRILIAPYGEVRTAHGTFVVDDQAMQAVIAAYAAHGTDLPIDFEHQSLGGPYSAPNGLAPAAGWIKRLIAVPPAAPRDATAVADEPGLWADVEWTAPAAEQLRSRQYRYLSPVALVRADDRRMVGLHSAALTNTPAIDRMRPVVARAACPIPPSPPAQAISHPAPLCALARLRNALSAEAEADAESVLALAAERISALTELIRAREATDLVELASAAGKLGPLQREWAQALALRDPTAFSEWYQHAPQVVPLGRIAPPAATDEPRAAMTAQRRAREDYRRHADFLGRLCSEEAFIADAMRGTT